MTDRGRVCDGWYRAVLDAAARSYVDEHEPEDQEPAGDERWWDLREEDLNSENQGRSL
jgi:hypothetical protein